MTGRARIAALFALGLVVIALAVIVARGDGGHALKATFPSAVNVVPGAEVRTGGVRVGKVDSIEVHGDAARLTLAIDDDGVWPLRRGTRASIRLGGTISYANRYVELTPGPASAAALADGAELPAQDGTSPFEFDELFNTFDARTRAGMGELIDNGAATLGSRGPELRRGLRDGGRGLGEGGRLFAALADDKYALQTPDARRRGHRGPARAQRRPPARSHRRRGRDPDDGRAQRRATCGARSGGCPARCAPPAARSAGWTRA